MPTPNNAQKLHRPRKNKKPKDPKQTIVKTMKKEKFPKNSTSVTVSNVEEQASQIRLSSDQPETYSETGGREKCSSIDGNNVEIIDERQMMSSSYNDESGDQILKTGTKRARYKTQNQTDVKFAKKRSRNAASDSEEYAKDNPRGKTIQLISALPLKTKLPRIPKLINQTITENRSISPNFG